jgi:hypothetical protein
MIMKNFFFYNLNCLNIIYCAYFFPFLLNTYTVQPHFPFLHSLRNLLLLQPIIKKIRVLHFFNRFFDFLLQNPVFFQNFCCILSFNLFLLCFHYYYYYIILQPLHHHLWEVILFCFLYIFLAIIIILILILRYFLLWWNFFHCFTLNG